VTGLRCVANHVYLASGGVIIYFLIFFLLKKKGSDLIGAVPDASLNMIGRPDDDDPCPYKPEYNIIRKWQHSCCFSLSPSTLEREKQHGGFCRERGSQTHSRLCVTSREQWPALLFLSSVSNCVVYIEKRRYWFSLPPVYVCVCVLSYAAAAVEEKHKTIGPARIERKMFSFFSFYLLSPVYICVEPASFRIKTTTVWYDTLCLTSPSWTQIQSFSFDFFVDSSLFYYRRINQME
jgi:hypothetical protein